MRRKERKGIRRRGGWVEKDKEIERRLEGWQEISRGGGRKGKRLSRTGL
jgi:hypothetical protein